MLPFLELEFRPLQVVENQKPNSAPETAGMTDN
jgi:hypothetical protein